MSGARKTPEAPPTNGALGCRGRSSSRLVYRLDYIAFANASRWRPRKVTQSHEKSRSGRRPRRRLQCPCFASERAARLAHVDLTRPRQANVARLEELVLLREPPGRSRHREDGGKERRRNADRALQNARVEVDVRIEVTLDEVVVFERNAFEFELERKERVLPDTDLVE